MAPCYGYLQRHIQLSRNRFLKQSLIITRSGFSHHLFVILTSCKRSHSLSSLLFCVCILFPGNLSQSKNQPSVAAPKSADISLFTAGLLSAWRHTVSVPLWWMYPHIFSLFLTPEPQTVLFLAIWSHVFSWSLSGRTCSFDFFFFFCSPFVFKVQTDVLPSVKSNLTPPPSRAVYRCVLRQLQMQYELWTLLFLLSAGRCIAQYYCMVAACQYELISGLQKRTRTGGKRATKYFE